MFSPNDQSGLFLTMGALAALVMAGVGLSIMADRKWSVSKRGSEYALQLGSGKEEIASLSDRVEKHQGHFERLGPERQRTLDTHREVLSEIRGNEAKLVELAALKPVLVREIEDLDGRFSEYRVKYTRTERAGAAGESLGTLEVSGGRVYEKAVIKRVTDVGLEISHEHGMARVQMQDLDAGMRDRFQWNVEERRRRLKEEEKQRDALTAKREDGRRGKPAAGKRGRRPARTLSAEREKIEERRSGVRLWMGRVSQLRKDAAEARSAATNGSSASVPGSLETWDQRATRLEVWLRKSEVELEVAREQLREVSPRDSLLRKSVTRDY